MQESICLSQVCASALLDAYCRNDEPRISSIEAEVRTMGAFYATSPAESERFELLSGIAFELHRSARLAKTVDADPYLRLLVHLAYPEAIGSGLTHLN